MGNDDQQPPALPTTLTVDGETFTITARPDGGYHYVWLTGRNEGYGFSSSRTHTVGNPDAPTLVLTLQQHEDSIRDFLAMIDPDTGYIE
ncbi:hypothetical protein RND64_08800 [Gordonia sp. w5E2]|uniref:Uncharacterized protein n=1 Tax=Gordonia jacobaea TaxID=122202 RepID=A0ABR5IGZ9_9ACTN|nr:MULTISPECIES: hypothetical protein [Gordonia]KNA92917.1 hypothetical protein ABW18_00065 [Gordonia jacobaea]